MEVNYPTKIISRIAPTPSGFLHKGNAFSFLLSWLWTRSLGGKLLLRIDDSDAARARPEFIEDIFYTLDWLGLDYDIGPEGPEDFALNFSQQHRMSLYESFLKELKGMEGLVFACNCSRKEIQQQSVNGLYPGSCRRKGLAFGKKNVAWRIAVPEQEKISYVEWEGRQLTNIDLGQKMGDFVVRRKDGLPAYQLISLADDMFYGVNFIVRGGDLRLSTGAQLYLASCLNLQQGKWQSGAKSFMENVFFHHPLVLDDAGAKLSKSQGANSVHMMREAGKKPVEIYSMVARFYSLPAGCSHSLAELLDAFRRMPLH